VSDLKSLFESGDYDNLIGAVRERLAEDPRGVTDPTVKQWIGRRWRDLFLKEAVKDEQAVSIATKSRLPSRLSRKELDVREAVALRFLKDITAEDYQVELPEPQYDRIENTTMILCPGLLTGLLHPGAHAFSEEAPMVVEERGWPIFRADLHPLRGGEANEEDLIAALDRGEGYDAAVQPIENPVPPEGKVILLGYSKGAPDIQHFLVDHPEYADRISAVFSWAGANGGSYTANDIYEAVKDLDVQSATDRLHAVLAMSNPMVSEVTGLRRVDEYDVVTAFRDLSTDFREAFNAANSDTLDGLNIPFFTVSGSTTPMEVPNFQFLDTVKMTKFDANNDMQLTQRQASLDFPMATRLGMLHGTHWDIAYAPFPRRMRAVSPNLDHPFPKKAALIANWELLAELGIID
jgi:hypothetical protein